MKHKQRIAGLERRLEDYKPLASNDGFNQPGSLKKNSPEGVLGRNARRMAAGMNGSKLPSYNRK